MIHIVKIARNFIVGLVVFITLSKNAVPESTWSWTPNAWTRTEDYGRIQGFSARPDEKVVGAITVEWRQPELDALGNICIIRGQLTRSSDEEKTPKPVDWFQGLTLYMANASDAKPDWSTGMNEKDTLSGTAIVDSVGMFVFRIDLRKSPKDRTQAQPFQFGLALAQHTGDNESQHVVWNSKTPVIPNSVKALHIPAAPKLSHELDLINRASGWPFSNPNGVVLIRVVNALQRLGKEKTLTILEEYVELTDTANYREEQEIVFWIIRTLFEPIRAEDQIPVPKIAVYFAESENGAMDPITIVDDIPFMLGRQIGLGGVPEHPLAHVKWARLHGDVRKQPLKPSANPLEAAKTVLNRKPFQQLSDFWRPRAIDSVRSQALGMVQGVIPAKPRRSDGTIGNRQC